MDPSRERDVEQGPVVTESAPAVTPEPQALAGPLTAARIAALQRGAGNAAVARLLNGRAPTGGPPVPRRPRSHGDPSALARLLDPSSPAGGAGTAAEDLLEGATGDGAGAAGEAAAAPGGAAGAAAGGAAGGVAQGGAAAGGATADAAQGAGSAGAGAAGATSEAAGAGSAAGAAAGGVAEAAQGGTSAGVGAAGAISQAAGAAGAAAGGVAEAAQGGASAGAGAISETAGAGAAGGATGAAAAQAMGGAAGAGAGSAGASAAGQAAASLFGGAAGGAAAAAAAEVLGAAGAAEGGAAAGASAADLLVGGAGAISDVLGGAHGAAAGGAAGAGASGGVADGKGAAGGGAAGAAASGGVSDAKGAAGGGAAGASVSGAAGGGAAGAGASGGVAEAKAAEGGAASGSVSGAAGGGAAGAGASGGVSDGKGAAGGGAAGAAASGSVSGAAGGGAAGAAASGGVSEAKAAEGGAAGAAASGSASGAAGGGAAASGGVTEAKSAAGGGTAGAGAAGGVAEAKGAAAAAGGLADAKKSAAGGGVAETAKGGAGKGAAEDAKGAGGGGAAGAAHAGGGGGAGGGGAGPAINKDPHADPAFQAMKGKSATAAGGSKTHTPAPAGAANAQGAAVPPANDMSSQAQAAQVDEMATKEPGAFDRAAFIQAVKEAVDNSAPKNLEEADDFKEGGAAEVKGKVTGIVKGGKEDSQKDIKDATVAAPDASKAKAKPVEPMQNDPAGQATPTVGAANAMPAPVPPQATDLSAGPNAVDKQMADAEVTDEQIKKSNEPAFKDALTARDDAKEHSDKAPDGYRKTEQGVLGKAKGDAQGLEGKGLQEMHGARGQALQQALGHKQGAKTEDEGKRAKVASDIQGIYERTKTDVTKTLSELDGKVDQAFSSGEGAARKNFEDYVGKRMDAYKDDRYSGILGPAKWVKDKLAGMPDEVNSFYAEGKTRYLADMDTVIGKVADVVGASLTAARARITAGKAEIAKYVAQLPQDLQKVGKEAESKLEGQFEQLSSDVDSKQSEMVDVLARKYVESRDALDARIDEMKAANRGLVDKAIDAVQGVIKTIIQLKNMLLGVLAKAADVIGDIIADPIGFLGKLVDGIKAGLSRFVGNIASHLQEGLMGWLFGAIGRAGIQLPKNFDIAGIFDLVMQVLGLTYRQIRARVVKLVGEKVVARLEQTVDVFKVLVTEGIPGLWKWIKDKVGDLEEMVIGGIKTFIIEKVIKAGITWLIAFLNPAAAFIKACKMIYDVIMFIIERGSEIMDFVRSILDSIGAIAKGNIGIVAQKVEDSLARALPLAISFLASLLGLGGISEKIQSIIHKVQAPIGKAVDTVVMGAVKGAKKLFGGAAKWVKGKYEKGKTWVKDKATKAKDWAKDKAGAAKDWAEEKLGLSKPVSTGFDMAGKPHTLTATASEGGRVRVIMASSNPGDLMGKARAALAATRKANNGPAAAALEGFIARSGPKVDELERIERTQQEQAREAARMRIVRDMAADLVAIGAEHKLTDLASYEALDLPDVELNRLVYDALIQARKQMMQRRGERAGQPVVPGEENELAERFDTVMHGTAAAYAGACSESGSARLPRGGDVTKFRGNVFGFAGSEYFVDHDANYILPNAVVGDDRGTVDGRVYVASKRVLASAEEMAKDPRRSLVAQYKYKGSRSIDKFADDARFVAEGGHMDDEQGAMFLASMIAETRRNPNANLGNLLLMNQGGKEGFFEASPMTKGGTAAGDKFRDPTLGTLPDSQPQPPIKVTEAEIKLVSQRFKANSGSDLAEAVKELGHDQTKALLIEFLVQEGNLGHPSAS